MTRLPLLLSLAGCDEPPLRVVLLDAWTGDPVLEQRDYLDEACDLLEVQCEQVTEPYGAVRVQLLLIGDVGIQGTVLDLENVTACHRAAAAKWADARVIAHEVGHTLLGLHHHPDPGNLMRSCTCDTGAGLSDKQRRRISREVRNMAACR